MADILSIYLGFIADIIMEIFRFYGRYISIYLGCIADIIMEIFRFYGRLSRWKIDTYILHAGKKSNTNFAAK